MTGELLAWDCPRCHTLNLLTSHPETFLQERRAAQEPNASFQSDNKDIRRGDPSGTDGGERGGWAGGVGRGAGLEPDVPFPENRHVRSPRKSGAAALAHQPAVGAALR